MREEEKNKYLGKKMLKIIDFLSNVLGLKTLEHNFFVALPLVFHHHLYLLFHFGQTYPPQQWGQQSQGYHDQTRQA